jgi:hypothetical protein
LFDTLTAMDHPIQLREVTLDPVALGATAAECRQTRHLGRPCLRFEDASLTPTVPGVGLVDGVVEVDLAVTGERAFHGVVWRVQGIEDFESFFVRPHQSGNPDAIQYTPVNHGISSWQLYHGPGFWAPVAVPIDAWFTIRVACSGTRADVYVDDLATPALRIAELKRPPARGGIGLQVGGPGLHVARLAWSPQRPTLEEVVSPTESAQPGVIRDWEVSDPFPEHQVAGAAQLPPSVVSARSWAALVAEPSGLLDLSRAHGVRDGRNTVLVRTTIPATVTGNVPLSLGFSDRAVVFLNGRALFRGDDTYRSRDYRFLGSIGYWDTVYLPLRAGANELVIAVSEDLGGWGVQGRFDGDGR